MRPGPGRWRPSRRRDRCGDWAGVMRPGLAGAGRAGRGPGAPGLTAIGPVRRRLFPRLAGPGPGRPRGPHLRRRPGSRVHARASWTCSPRAGAGHVFPARVRWPGRRGLAAEIAAAGHEIGVHGWEHRYATLRGPRALLDDLARATRRAGRGDRHRAAVLPAAVRRAQRGRAGRRARRLGLTPVLWTCWGREWAPGATPGSVYATLSQALAGGGTVLLHDSDCTSPAGGQRRARRAAAAARGCAGAGCGSARWPSMAWIGDTVPGNRRAANGRWF